MNWFPKRSLAETEAILRRQGSLHEVEKRLVGSRLLKVYKNLWSSTRDFWVEAVRLHAKKTYIVFDDKSWTYEQANEAIMKAAKLFKFVYNIKKGDRVAICSRNCPEFLLAFWACQLIGAVPVAVNAWLPLEPLFFCLQHTRCSLYIVDPERAKLLDPVASKFGKDSAFLVVDTAYSEQTWNHMETYSNAININSAYIGDSSPSLGDIEISPEDHAVIMFTSGTTGLPKGVLSTQRQFLTNVLNTIVGSQRAALRRGEDPSTSLTTEGLQQGSLIAVPLFHVTGLTSYTMMTTALGRKIVLMRKWEVEEAARLIRRENIVVAGGVPAMIADLMDSTLVGHPLQTLFFGGCPTPEAFIHQAVEIFPNTTLSQGYGLTETNSVAVGIAGEDYIARPKAAGLPSPVNEVAIVVGNKSVPPGCTGEVWLRGPNIMEGYWDDPDATKQILTADGWLRTGDLGILDQEGFLYIQDRIKDIIIRGGENVPSVMVENALYADLRIAEAAAVGVPDKRLGELVTALVSVKPGFSGKVTETGLISFLRKRLPSFAVPVMIIIQDTPFELTPSRKIMKTKLRERAIFKWEERRQLWKQEIQAKL